VRSSAFLADKISVSLTTKPVNRIVRVTPPPFCPVLAVRAPQDRHELGDLRLFSSQSFGEKIVSQKGTPPAAVPEVKPIEGPYRLPTQ
jgi:hypothetical protein